MASQPIFTTSPPQLLQSSLLLLHQLRQWRRGGRGGGGGAWVAQILLPPFGRLAPLGGLSFAPDPLGRLSAWCVVGKLPNYIPYLLEGVGVRNQSNTSSPS